MQLIEILEDIFFFADFNMVFFFKTIYSAGYFTSNVITNNLSELHTDNVLVEK